MSKLAEIQDQLQDTGAALAGLEKATLKDPMSRSLRLSRLSLEKRQRDLEAQFLELTRDIRVDVCHYRLLSDSPRLKLRSLASSLANFQSLVTVTCDAILGGPKKKAFPSPQLARSTAFDYAYALAGSAGFVLTLRDERPGVASEMDRAIQAIFDLAKSTTASQIQELGKQLGVAAMRQFYKWVADHAEPGLGVDIDWRRGDEIRAAVLVQNRDFKALKGELESMGEEERVEYHLSGNLVGVDTWHKTFHLDLGAEGQIRGSFDDAINPSQQILLPMRYLAHITKTTRIEYSADTQWDSFHLNSLEPIEQGVSTP